MGERLENLYETLKTYDGNRTEVNRMLKEVQSEFSKRYRK